MEKTGLFGKAQREIYTLDKYASQADEGATDIRRSLIIPHRAYQVMEEKNPPTFRGHRKYVVGKSGEILSYR